MKVILHKDIEHQGKQGDIVVVTEGYARNYLFPRKLAAEAAGGELKNLQNRTAMHERRTARLLGDAESTAARLADQIVTITMKAGENNRLYGRVTTTDIANAITRELRISVDKRKVGLLDPIKSVGEYEVPIKLHSDITVSLKVAVVAEAS